MYSLCIWFFMTPRNSWSVKGNGSFPRRAIAVWLIVSYSTYQLMWNMRRSLRAFCSLAKSSLHALMLYLWIDGDCVVPVSHYLKIYNDGDNSRSAVKVLHCFQCTVNLSLKMSLRYSTTKYLFFIRNQVEIRWLVVLQ